MIIFWMPRTNSVPMPITAPLASVSDPIARNFKCLGTGVATGELIAPMMADDIVGVMTGELNGDNTFTGVGVFISLTTTLGVGVNVDCV